jgi:hypothetical protein
VVPRNPDNTVYFLIKRLILSSIPNVTWDGNFAQMPSNGTWIVVLNNKERTEKLTWLKYQYKWDMIYFSLNGSQ